MDIQPQETITEERLIGEAKKNNQNYGSKFKKFGEGVFNSFDKICRIRFSRSLNLIDFGKTLMPLAIYGAIMHKKYNKYINQNFTGIQFLDDLRSKSKDVIKANPNLTIETTELFLNYTEHLMKNISEINKISKLIYLYIYELMNNLCQRKPTGKIIQVEHYKDEEIKKIGNAFRETIYLINYDDNKQVLNNVQINDNYVYLVKAKEMYFILIKDPDIAIIEAGYISHEEFAEIFNLEKKLERVSPVKIKSQIKVQPISPSKISHKMPAEISFITQSQVSLKTSKIQSSVLFPDDVKCNICCKKVSQFNALFWNYSHYCFECIVNPKYDVSFIPNLNIQKFLKNKKFNTKQYFIVCAECKSQTIIPGYRPWDKPKSYRCLVCQKTICVQHERIIMDCFCYCMKCDRRTLTIPSIFIKYCLGCKTRYCQICLAKDKKQCQCICKICGKNIEVDHQDCHPNCHGCQARNVNLMKCGCNRMLCGMCYFESLEPNAKICMISIPS